MRNAVIALVGAFAFVGCRTADVDTTVDNGYTSTIKEAREEYTLGEKAEVFWTDFALDLTDMISVGLSAGNGIEANAHITKLYEAGAGYFGGYKVGVLPRSAGVWREKQVQGGLAAFPASVWYWQDGDRADMKGTSTLNAYEGSWQDFNTDIRGDKTDQWLSVGASAHLIAIGAFADVHGYEVADVGVNILAIPVWIADMLRVPGAEQLWKWMDIVGDDTESRSM